MKILVNATAAETGGAETIVRSVYNEYLNTKDSYIFLLSKEIVKPNKNVKVIIVRMFKKCKIYRLYFSMFKLRKLVKIENIDIIINLNHTYIFGTNSKQKIILHQSLPFSDYRFSPLKDFKLWFKKNVSGIVIKYALKKVDYVEVPSYWLKKAIVNKLSINEKKITVKKPFLEINFFIKNAQSKSSKVIFIYPTGNLSYKNIDILLESIILIAQERYSYFEVLLTLEKEKTNLLNRYISNRNLPVKFIGYIDRNTLYQYYSNSVLIYLSSIEAFGLPLLEAKLLGATIIALNKEYAHEILYDYDKVIFVDLDKKAIASAIEYQIKSSIVKWKLYGLQIYLLHTESIFLIF